jgi:DNA-binding NarL/FixJ family response regulator
MPTQGYPLIFIVEDNFVFNKLIANHLRANKFKRIESFHSREEYLINLYKKPDIVIQDYLMNEMNDNNITKNSIKSNLNTEFIFLSDLDNFSNNNHQNKDFILLTGSEKFDTTADIIKCGPHDYVVKDLSALNKLVGYFSHSRQIRLQTKYDMIGLALLITTLILIIIGLLR